jgi:hypothetical protein
MQLLLTTKKHFTIALWMPVRLSATAPASLHGCGGPWWDVEVILGLIINTYEWNPESKFRSQILPLQRCGHDCVHAWWVLLSIGKPQTPFWYNQIVVTHCSVRLTRSRQSSGPPPVKCGLLSVSWMQEMCNWQTFIVNFVRCMEKMPWVIQW